MRHLQAQASRQTRGSIFNVSWGVEFERWWVLKCKIFVQELTCSKDIVLKQSCNELWFVKSAKITDYGHPERK